MKEDDLFTVTENSVVTEKASNVTAEAAACARTQRRPTLSRPWVSFVPVCECVSVSVGVVHACMYLCVQYLCACVCVCVCVCVFCSRSCDCRHDVNECE